MAVTSIHSIKSTLLIKFPNKKLPNIEQLYDDREELIALRNEKNTQYKKTVSELKEIDKVREEIQNYLSGNERMPKKKKEIE